MSDWYPSILRVVLDAGGDDETLLLDWGAETKPFALPWRQKVLAVTYVDADFETYLARGGVGRQIRIERRLKFDTYEELHAAEIDVTVALPIRKQLQLDLRVGSLPTPDPTPAIDSVDEGTATYAHYRATAAVLEGAEPTPMHVERELMVAYTIKLGQLTKIL